MKKLIISLALVAAFLVSAPAMAITACVYNKMGRKMPITVQWGGTCKDSYTNMKKNYRMMYTCSGSSKATLKLKWKGYKAEYYKFPGYTTSKTCTDGNSLTMRSTKFGYKFNVFQGKGF